MKPDALASIHDLFRASPEHAARAVVVDTSPVHAAFMAGADETSPCPDWFRDSCVLPSVAPPFETTLMVCGTRLTTVEAFDLLDGGHRAEVGTVMESWSKLAGGEQVRARPAEGATWAWPGLSMEARWMLELVCWYRPSGQPLRPVMAFYSPVAADGRPMGLSGGLTVPGYDWSVLPRAVAESVLSTFTDSARFTLFAISLMHCKNIGTQEETEKPTRQVRRQRERKGERPAITYKVLDITPAGGSKRQGETTRLTAQHLCRGHFKTFTDDAPLFGKIVGTYWWAPQLRGNPESGVVHKDYRVHPAA